MEYEKERSLCIWVTSPGSSMIEAYSLFPLHSNIEYENDTGRALPGS